MLARFRPNLTSNFALAMASLFIAFVIWLIGKADDFTTQGVMLPIRYQALENAEITITPARASVSLRMLVSEAKKIDMESAWIELKPSAVPDPSEWLRPTEQVKTIPLDINMVTLRGLPNSVQPVAIEINQLTLRGKFYSREARIAPRTTGEPASGFRQVGELRADPPTVHLTASPARLDELDAEFGGDIEIPTTPIDLAGRSADFVANPDLDLPDGVRVVNPDEQSVAVSVSIQETTATRTIAEVPIRVQIFSRDLRVELSPRTARVSVEGPASIVNRLDPDDFNVSPELAPENRAGFEQDVALECLWFETVETQVKEKTRILGVEPRSVRIAIRAVATPTPTPLPTPIVTPFPIRTMTPSPTPAPAAEPTTPSLELAPLEDVF